MCIRVGTVAAYSVRGKMFVKIKSGKDELCILIHIL